MAGPAGTIVVLNGVPRSGKTSIARAMQEQAPEPWLNIGVDAMAAMVPPALRPGIGLRPGGERPDLEPAVARLYEALIDTVLAVAGRGLNVVADVGIHDHYSRPLGVLATLARRLSSTGALLVGVRCPMDEIVRRRDEAAAAGGPYAGTEPDGTVPDPVLRWEAAVHAPGVYDLEVDTGVLDPAEAAALILDVAATRPPTALHTINAR